MDTKFYHGDIVNLNKNSSTNSIKQEKSDLFITTLQQIRYEEPVIKKGVVISNQSPDSSIMDFGKIEVDTNNEWITINFKYEYEDRLPVITATFECDNENNKNYINIRNITKKSFEIYVKTETKGFVNWIAIG